jgi:prepilin-type N-terminal cleavage/methylation domain-containing protein
MLEKLKNRLAGQEGFTLIEMLVVMQIIAIITVIATPELLSTATQARAATEQSNVSSAISIANEYYLDTVKNSTPNTFGGISGSKLRAEAPGVGKNVKAGAKTVSTTNDAYCIQDSEDSGKTYWHYEGGTGGANVLVVGACPSAYNAA